MSVLLMARVFAESDTTGNDRLVLLALADEANDDGTHCFPSQRRIADKARTSLSTARRCLERLEQAGEIRVVPPDRQGRGHVTEYVLARGKGSQSDHLPPERETRRNAPKRAAPLANPAPTLNPVPDGSSLRSELTHPGGHASMADRHPVAFETFWAKWRHKVGRGAACKAWDRAVRRARPDLILAGVDRFNDDLNQPWDEPQFLPHPATWLNQDRWEDGPAPPRNGAAPSPRLQGTMAAAQRFLGGEA